MAGSGAFGIYFDGKEIDVRLWMDGEVRPILRLPAVYTYSSSGLGEALAGMRAVNYQKCHREKRVNSVLKAMRDAADGIGYQTKEDAQVCCNALMRQLRKSLDQTPYRAIRDCVAVVSVSNLRIYNGVRVAMEEAGFRVLRLLTAGVACTISRSRFPGKNRCMGMTLTIGDERQYVEAECGSEVIEICENRITPAQTGVQMPVMRTPWHDRDEILTDQDETSRRELAAAAAEGAAIQGAALQGLVKNFLLLDVVPWEVGVKIVNADRTVCLPMTWVTWLPEGQLSIPAKCAPVSVHLDSGVQGKKLCLYTGQGMYNQDRVMPGREEMIREWDLAEVCRGFGPETKRLELGMDFTVEVTKFHITLRKPGTDGAEIRLDYPECEPVKRAVSPVPPAYVTQSMLEDLWKAAAIFQAEAEMLRGQQEDPAVDQGIRNIAKQSLELFYGYRKCNEEVRMEALIESMLGVADHLEYGIKAALEREDWLLRDEYTILSGYYKTICACLRELGLTEIEAEGMRFDPYVHHALMAEHRDGVEGDIVIDVIQKGYTRGGKLLRPAKVKVTK